MAKRKKKTRADKETEAKGAKKAAKLAEKETTAHKPTEDKPKSKPNSKSKPKTKPKAKSRAKPKVKSKSDIPSVIETPLSKTDKPEEISKEIDIGKSDTETTTEGLESTQADVVAEEIPETVVETESLGGKAVSLQTEDKQASFVFEPEDSDIAKSQGQEVDGIQADTLTDNVPESAVEAPDATETATEKEDDSQMGVESTDTEILTDDLDVTKTVDDTDDSTEAVSEEIAEAVSPEGEVESIQTGDEQTDIIVEAEDSDTSEDLSQDTGDIQTDMLVDDVSEPVVEVPDVTEIATENEDGSMEGVENTDTEKLADDLEAPQTDDATELVIEEVAEAVSPDGEVGSMQTEGEQTDIIVESEDSDATENLSQDAVDEQTGMLADDVSEPAVGVDDTTESVAETKEDFQADQQVEDSTEVDVEGTDTEIPTEDLEATHTVDQSGDVTEAILEAAAETERLAEEAEKLKAEDEQADFIFKSEDPDTVESPSQEAEDIQTDDQAGEVIEAETEIERLAEESESLQAEDEQTDVIVEAKDPDTVESPSQEAEDIQTDGQVDEVIEAETEVDKLEEEAGSLQAEDEQTDVIVEAEDPGTVESPSQDAEDIQTDEQVDEVIDTEAEVDKLEEEAGDLEAEDGQAGITVEEEDLSTAETPSQGAEVTDDTITDGQADEAIEATAEETVIEDSSKIKTFVDRIKKMLSGISSIGSRSDESTEVGAEDIQADAQDEAAVETVVEDPESVEDFTESADDTLADRQVDDADKEVVGSHADEIQAAVYSDNKRSRTKKAGIIISIFIMTAAVILLIVASVERRSAKSALVQINKVAESIKQMQGETLKDREQITHSQIESKELVIDALSLTRNGLELERANSDEVEVKRIIGIFINDIDERITKIKGNIVLLRNKLKEAD